MVAPPTPTILSALIAAATLANSVVPSIAGEDASAEVACANCGDIIMLEDFAGPRHKWAEMNDPVMGGKSTGSFDVDGTEKVGIFHGSVEIVSFLDAPGFIKAETTAGESWPDASSCEGFELSLRSSTPEYEGFRVSFGNKRPPDAFPYIYGFKAGLKLSPENGFQTVRLPFDHFTDKWDAGTGDAVVTCAENKEYCPDEASKKDLFSIAVWAEGVEGKVDLELRSVAAYGCNSGSSSDSSSDSDSDDNDNEPLDSSTGSDTISIEDFSDPTHTWNTLNDPVMGGRSESSLAIGDGIAHFEGTCAIVPSLDAPGFITMVTGGYGSPTTAPFPDVSSCTGLALVLRTAMDYEGYYLSFGTDRAPGARYAMGYKTHLDLSAGNEFSEVKLPFSKFSSSWDDATGKTTVTCADDKRFCPSLDNLKDMKTVSFWGEGVEGAVDLEIKYIGAYGCGDNDGTIESTSALTAALVTGSSSSPAALTAGIGHGMVTLAVIASVALFVVKRRGSSSSQYIEVNSVFESNLV